MILKTSRFLKSASLGLAALLASLVTPQVTDAQLQSEDLNRYLLVVKNAPGMMRVTWGADSNEYSAAELAVGVNSAAGFLGHPFEKPFDQVERAIRQKQSFETVAIKGLLNNQLKWLQYFPDQPDLPDHLEQLKEMIFEKSQNYRNSVSAEVAPVRHSIQIEPVS